MSDFRNPALKQLTDQQVRFAPPARRLEQLKRVEQLLLEIDPERHYPYQYICYRVTDFRPDSYPDLLISGKELEHDLALVINGLAASLPPEEVAEPVVTLEEISKRLNVSTKTISRWRDHGLIGMRTIRNGKRQLGYLKSVVDRFLSTHKDRVERSGRFSQMSDGEKEEILRRAKRLARVGGGSLTEISRRIARRLGRSPETVRYTIKNYDREHPEQALFAGATGPLDAEVRDTIYGSYRRGISVDTLAKRFHRTRTSMYRIINEVRAQRLLAQPLDYIPHASFDDPTAAIDILGPMPGLEEYEAKRREMRPPRDVPPELASLYEVPLLTREQEQHLFRKMNYLKHHANRLRRELCRAGTDGACELDPGRLRIQKLEEIEKLQAEAEEVKKQLINCNMRLVWAIAKRHAGGADNIFELVSDGNMSLIRAVDKFDFSRGNKFSTYASWAIMKNFARSIPDEKRHRERYVTGHEDLFDIAPDTRSDEHESLASAEQTRHRINRLLEYLDPRERQIIRMRAGLDNYSENMTLEQIGKELNITKERVRQLHVRIMNKLKTIAREQNMDLP